MPLVASATPQQIPVVVDALAAGGVAAIPWGRARSSTYLLVTCAYNAQAVSRLNAIKGRPPRQVIAMGVSADRLGAVVDISRSHALATRAASRGTAPERLIQDLWQRGPVGLLLAADARLPSTLISEDQLHGQSVMLPLSRRTNCMGRV